MTWLLATKRRPGLSQNFDRSSSLDLVFDWSKEAQRSFGIEDGSKLSSYHLS